MAKEQEHLQKPTTPRHSGLAEDRRLVENIKRGSEASWREFLDRYTGLIYGVLRRHLISEDEDEIRNVYVDILKSLHDGELFKYQNRSRLATWLTVLSRAKAFDYRRKLRGRNRLPGGVEQLTRFDRQVLQLYFVERLGLEIVAHTLHWKGYRVGTRDIVSAIERIEERLDNRFLKRLDDEAVARVSGGASVKVLRYLAHLSAQQQRDMVRDAPDQAILEEEARNDADQVRELIAGLRPEERKVVKLRFEKKLSARAIAEKLGIENPRRVYTILDRILAKFRATL